MEDILNRVKPFGKFQKLSILLVGMSSALVAMLTYSITFYGAEPKLICKPTSANATNYTLGNNDICQIWNHLVDNFNKTNDFTNIVSQNYSCEFDKTHFGLSIVNEWGLVCEKRYLATQTQTLFLLGTFTGIFLGYFLRI